MILKLFLESRTTGRRDDIRGKGSIASIHSEIVQHEFFISLIKIAVYKYITLAKKENALRKKKGYHADIYSQAATPTQSHALHLLYLECLKPVIDKLPAGVTIKASLGSDEVLLIFHKNITLLSCIFCEYAECSFNVNFPNESAQSGMMNLKQFCSFATDTEFLGDSELDMQYEVSIKDVRQVFSVSQHDTVMNENEICFVKEQGKDSNIHQEQMVLPEYLEAIARLGVIKFPNEGLDNYLYCIERAINKVCDHVKKK